MILEVVLSCHKYYIYIYREREIHIYIYIIYIYIRIRRFLDGFDVRRPEASDNMYVYLYYYYTYILYKCIVGKKDAFKEKKGPLSVESP